MNTVFNEIAEVCGFDATPENPVVSLTQSDLEYYGSQIVIECMRVCEDLGSYDCIDALKRRFQL